MPGFARLIRLLCVAACISGSVAVAQPAFGNCPQTFTRTQWGSQSSFPITNVLQAVEKLGSLCNLGYTCSLAGGGAVPPYTAPVQTPKALQGKPWQSWNADDWQILVKSVEDDRRVIEHYIQYAPTAKDRRDNEEAYSTVSSALVSIKCHQAMAARAANPTNDTAATVTPQTSSTGSGVASLPGVSARPSGGSSNEPLVASASPRHGGTQAAVPTGLQTPHQSDDTTVRDKNRILRSGTNCVVRDRLNNLSDFFENRCPFRVWIDFVDESGSSAAGPISPGKKEAVSKARGDVIWVACEYPSSAYTGRSLKSPKWKGKGLYFCVAPA